MMSFCCRFGSTRSSSVTRLAPIRPVMTGSLDPAMNNDGSLKGGYTAPSLERQAEVIQEALGTNIGGTPNIRLTFRILKH